MTACIVFRTHFWDEFVERQFARLRAVAGTLDVFVLVDETAGPVAGIGHDRVVRVTEAQLLQTGLARAGSGNLLWFNGDYPLYHFAALHDYDHVLQLEYDVVIEADLEALLGRVAGEGVDFVGLTKGEPTPAWPWLATCTGAYDAGEVEHQLICLSIFSRRALAHLHARRQAHSAQHRAGTLAAWPMCEGFIATELLRGGFVCRELSDFADVSQYDHWPPILEADLARPHPAGFIHPVLDEARYVASMQKYHVGIAGFLNPASLYHRKLRRLPVRRYARALAESFAFKLRRNLRSALRRSHA